MLVLSVWTCVLGLTGDGAPSCFSRYSQPSLLWPALSLSLSLSGRLKAEKVVGIVSTHARNFLKIILIISFLSDISFYIFYQ